MESASKNSHKRGRRVEYVYSSKKNDSIQKQSSEIARRKILDYYSKDKKING